MVTHRREGNDVFKSLQQLHDVVTCALCCKMSRTSVNGCWARGENEMCIPSRAVDVR